MKPKTKTETVLTILKTIALLAFIFYSNICVMYLVLFVASIFTTQPFSNIFMELNLLELKDQNFLKYTLTVTLLIVLAALKAIVWYRASGIIQKIKVENPFTMEMTRRLEKISYSILFIWILGYIARTFSFWLTNQRGLAESLREQMSTEGFLFMAGLLFIVSQIFRRGVELQSENELTV